MRLESYNINIYEFPDKINGRRRQFTALYKSLLWAQRRCRKYDIGRRIWRTAQFLWLGDRQNNSARKNV